jgi:ADP-heptose:LPS heptosyltransferase
MIMITPLIRRLYEDGYEVTMNITPYCAEVLKNNPFVSNIVLQERDMIPNQDLGAYWAEWLQDYDKYINLSESIEGKLLKVEGRRDFYTQKAWRDNLCTANYYDHTMALGGYTGVTGSRGELYFSNAEIKQAKYLREKFKDRFMIMWGLKGSSHHKIYPLLVPVLSQWLDAHPDAIAILVGGEADKPLQFDHPQVVGVAGDMKIRDVFCLTQFADLVVGPESSVINAAGCFPVPKITMLSHSNHGNLCSNWEGDFCLQADVACSPCHQLHYSLESCPLVGITEAGKTEPSYTGPVCASVGFPPARILARLDEVYERFKIAPYAASN